MIYIFLTVLTIGIVVMIVSYIKTPNAINYVLSNKLMSSNVSIEDDLSYIKLVNRIDLNLDKEEITNDLHE